MTYADLVMVIGALIAVGIIILSVVRAARRE